MAPLIVVHCSNPKEALQSKAVILRVEFETNQSVLANATAYCLILHDGVFTYNGLPKAARQLKIAYSSSLTIPVRKRT